jgi:genome maintenance exonuclease 1
MSLTKHFKYKYHPGKATTDRGTRIYEVQGFRMPSVTTILAQTKDDEYIRTWRNKIGHEEADRIFNLSSKRGTAMHKFLEKHIQGSGYEDLTEIGVQAKPMAQKIIDVGLTPVSVYYGSEVTLYYPGLYAGTTDLTCLHNDKDTVVDFKQANKPKKREWIDDYFLQTSAYAMAHDYVYGSNIEQCIIMVCTPDLYYQEFKIDGAELRSWKHKFLKRLDMYYEKKRDYKEERQIDTNELLKEFEKEANARANIQSTIK